MCGRRKKVTKKKQRNRIREKRKKEREDGSRRTPGKEIRQQQQSSREDGQEEETFQGRVEDLGDHGRVRSIPCPAWSVAGRIALCLSLSCSFVLLLFLILFYPFFSFLSVERGSYLATYTCTPCASPHLVDTQTPAGKAF